MLALQQVFPVRPSCNLKNRSANTIAVSTCVQPARVIVSVATVYRICIKTASTQHQHSTTADMQAGCFLLQPLTLDSRFLQERFAPVYAVEDVSNKKAQNG